MTLQELSKKELLECFGFKSSDRINRKKLIRAIILEEISICQESMPEIRTLRDFWYDKVKALLMRAEGDKALEKNWVRKATQALSSILSKMVLNGELQYKDIGIQDDTRDVHFGEEGVYDGIIIFVEDHATYNRVKNIAEVYDIVSFEGGGWDATSNIEKIAEELKERCDEDHEYLILCLTDYDPTGFQMVKDIDRRANILGLRCSVERIGINPKDVPKDQLKFKWFPVPIMTAYHQEWVEEHGIEGRYGIEIQAIVPKKRRELIVKALKEHCPEEKMYDDLRRLSLEEVPNETCEQIVEGITRILEEQINDKASEITGEDGFDDREDIASGTLPRIAIVGDNFIGMDNSELVDRCKQMVLRQVKKITLNPEGKLEIAWKGNGGDGDE